MSKVIDISEIKQDGLNFNKGTFEGTRMMENSFRKFGSGRSILVDKDNNIIAGNKTAETAQAIGISKVRVVESDGKKLIVVKRTDLSLDSKEGRELAIADNATSQANLCWDTEAFERANELYGFDTKDFDADFEVAEDAYESYGEVDTDAFDEEQTLKIKLSTEEYQKVISKLQTIDENMSVALLKLLGYYE